MIPRELVLLFILFMFGVFLAIDIGKARAGDDSLVKLEKWLKKKFKARET